MIMDTQKPMRTKPENLKRSAIAPVGIVAAVSMNTIWNRKKARIPVIPPVPRSMKPEPPRKPHCPNRTE